MIDSPSGAAAPDHPRPLVRWITLDDWGERVSGPPGLIYSTSPRIAGASDGCEYFTKGPQLEVVVAEAVGYELASRIGLDVPPWALCHVGDNDEVHFASRAMRLRSGVDRMMQAGLVTNSEFLPSMIAFDAWTSNRDRNAGNVIAEPVGGFHRADVRLLAIDFESADILRGVDRFTVTAHPPRAFRPTGELARHCVDLPFPAEACERISGVTKDEITGIFDVMQTALPGRPITWAPSASDFLVSRARRIAQLVREVWDA